MYLVKTAKILPAFSLSVILDFFTTFTYSKLRQFKKRKVSETMKQYMNYITEQLKALTAIPSPTGFTKEVAEYVRKTMSEMGYDTRITRKGTVISDIGGAGERLVLASHLDTLGAMVRSVKENGRLRPTTIGGHQWATCDGENCTVHTRDGKTFCGVVLNTTPSAHVADEASSRKEEVMEILLDENVTTKEATEALGIMAGDFIAMDPRTVIAPSGYIKSRFLDDKLSAAILIGLAKYIKDKNLNLNCSLTMIFTVYEEVGHGGCSGIPSDTAEVISVDMGCVGDDLECTEQKVSICAKASAGPYNYDVTTRLIQLAKKHDLNFAVDVYPHYSSDVDAALKSGYEIRHGLIGPGVYASHNYERSHIEGVLNTFELLKAYINQN